jgi:hypothetical protein
MLAVIGIIAVFAAVLGGFLLEHGNAYVLMQPAELLIVGGAAIGIVLVVGLSTERASAARRLLQPSGVLASQIVEVRGFPDHKLLKASDPNDASNRRISLVIRFND